MLRGFRFPSTTKKNIQILFNDQSIIRTQHFPYYFSLNQTVQNHSFPKITPQSQFWKKIKIKLVKYPHKNFSEEKGRSSTYIPVYLLGLFGLFQKKEEENPESELIQSIKRAVLLIQRSEFKAAEQVLHVALKLAQEQQNGLGITYIYDLLANLAFTQGQFGKAEKLFINVMNRLMTSGTSEDDIKINHVSLKLSKIYEHKKDFSKAEEGYKFCLKNLENRVKLGHHSEDEEDAFQLWAMSLDWYARFLLDRERMDEAFENFQKAYEMSLKINGEIHEQTVVLLNDLGTICFLKGNEQQAIDYLSKAIDIGQHLPNMEDFASVYVNLGNIYLQKKMYKEAKKHCKMGWQNATRHKNSEGIQEANTCLDELRKVMN